MIIARSPLRISLGGGGTDLPSFYSRHGGFLVAAAIDKYVYITLHQTFEPGLILKYSKVERAQKIKDVRHPLLRESLQLLDIKEFKLEIASMADIPAGTGLGSSGSFTTALLAALHAYKKDLVTPEKLAEEACLIEMERLKEPVGKQDPYIAAHGGVTAFEFKSDGNISIERLKISPETLHNLEDNLLLYFTGFSRNASSILKDQDVKSRQNDKTILENLSAVKTLGLESQKALIGGDLGRFAELLNLQWEYKKNRSTGMTNSQIDQWHKLALANGALGGKLIGAGGGGFLMFYAKEKARLRAAMAKTNLAEVRFRFDFEGTKLLAL